MKEQAILIMTTEKDVHPGLRSTASGPGWTRLYQAKDYYLDLSYKPEGKEGVLLGQLLREGSSADPIKVALVGPKGTPLQTQEVLPNTSFRLAVGEIKTHHLEITLGQTTLEVALS
ncbi:hypothetical protein [Meiothermus sp.]|uniref:hypothetical protein n=1 Tax=Meiothermus sp. TaxID=1955249 RepID=UPI0021DBAAFC|nr:hypothetical protein [Meiothermus sp.]GIW25287.1 MAG: hypothetical protein KatS3mg069_1554 [Meiothermus sp.]